MSLPLKLGLNMAPSGHSCTPPSRSDGLSRHGVCSQSTSAKVAEAENIISNLENENQSLKSELLELRSLYKQLTTEGEHENFDERRVTLLKSQVIQLERQILLLTEALGSRTSVLMEVENSLAAAVEFCRASLNKKDGSREVHLDVEDIRKLSATLESARAKLFSSTERTSSVKNFERPLLWFGDFIRNKSVKQPVTLFDICRGNIEHLNLKHVSRLESKLVRLYKELMLVDCTLRMCVRSSGDPNSHQATIPDAPTAVYGRLCSHVTKSCNQLQEVCSQLLQLSLLVPAAPLPALDRPIIAEMTTENVLNSFGKLAKSREARNITESLLKSVNYSVNLACSERNLLLEELEFHRAVYASQSDYIDSLFTCIRDSYSTFENELQVAVCHPLSTVLTAFTKLKETSSEQSLLEFIGVFRDKLPQLSETVEKLSAIGTVRQGDENGRQFAEYGEDFFRRLHQRRAECRRKRDLQIAEIDVVRRLLDEQTKDIAEVIAKNSSREITAESSTSKQMSGNQLHSPSVEDHDSYISRRYADDKQEKTCLEPATVRFHCDVESIETSLNSKASSSRRSHCRNVPPLYVNTASPIPREIEQEQLSRRSYSVIPGVAQQSLNLRPRKPANSSDRKSVENIPDTRPPNGARSASSLRLRSASLRAINGSVSTDVESNVPGQSTVDDADFAQRNETKNCSRPSTTPSPTTFLKRSSSLQTVQGKSDQKNSLKDRPPFWLPNSGNDEL